MRAELDVRGALPDCATCEWDDRRVGDRWLPLIGMAVGVAGTIVGILSRTGHYRGWARTYFNDSWPAHIRRAPLGWVIAGPAALLLSGVVFLRGREHEFPWVITVMVILFMLLILLHVFVMWRAPEWAKPRWLREKEGVGAGGELDAGDRFFFISMAAITFVALLSLGALLIFGIR